jgi:YbbR domain-containing protein
MSVATERFRGWMKRMLTREVPFKVLSIIFALLVWGWVQTQQIVTQRTRAEVKWVVPESLTWVDPVPKSLVVTIKGPQGLVRNVKKRTLRYDLDLKEAERGPLSIDFSSRSFKGIPEGVEVVQVSPPGVDVELDNIMERTIKVVPATVGDVASGYRLDSIAISPKIARISGPRSLVRAISEISTDVIDIAGLTSNKTFSLSLSPKARTVKPVEDRNYEVTVKVEPIIAQKTFNDVPIMARSEGWKTTPSTALVTLSGPAADVRELTADRISVQAHLPNPTPVGAPLKVEFDPTNNSAGLEVVHQGSKAIKIISVEPTEVALERSK